MTNTLAYDTTNRYIQYRAYLQSSPSRLIAPYLDSAAFFRDRAFVVDNTVMDFRDGTFTANTTNTPADPITPYVGLAKQANGGYVADGTYTGPVLDNGGAGTWDQIAWKVAPELAAGIQGLEGLWHLNGNWGDASGKGRATVAPAPEQYTDAPKLGTKAAVFNGSTTRAVVTLPAALRVNTIALWLKTESTADSLLELVDNATYLAISNRQVVAVGFTNAPATIYVNGRRNPQLGPGWNHVVLATESSASNLIFNIGEANDDFFEGQIDEISIYSRVLAEGEIEGQYVSQRRHVGGRLRFQVRSGNVNPPATPFAGPGNNPALYFEDPNGSAPAQFQRFFQYRAYFESDGLATPALDSVRVTYNSGAQFVHDTWDEFRAGSFDLQRTRWVGDGMGALDYYARGGANIDEQSVSGVQALWHLDELEWPAGNSVLDSSGFGNHGIPMGDAYPGAYARVGTRCGVFDGNGDAVSLAVPAGSSDFSISLWYNSQATNRCAFLSTYVNAATPYLALELNSDGTATPATGRVAFVISDGATTRTVSPTRNGLNDGTWHHVAGIRAGSQLHFYLDGVRVRTLEIGTGYSSPGSAGGFLAKMGAQNIFYNGLLDEVAVFNRALTDAEVAEQAAAGFDTRTPAIFTGPPINVGRAAIWERLGWVTDGLYSRPPQPGDVDQRGLWPLDSAAAGRVADVTGNGRTGVVTGATLDGAGRFSNCLFFVAGSDQRVAVADHAGLEPAQFTIEAWIRPALSRDFMVIDKSTAGAGYRLGADANGRYYFWVNGTTALDYEILRADQWTHLAGVYDANEVRLYVNGIPHGKAALPGALVDTAAELRMGLDRNGDGDFGGRLDEVGLTARALNAGEIWDHYLAGAATLKFQARSWDPAPQGNFIGPDGTTNTFFTAANGSDLLAVIGMNQNFQYQATLATEDYRWTPRLHGVWVDVSSYPSSNPWVIPAGLFGFTFPGRLTGFAEAPGPLNQGNMRYFVSGDSGTNWYFWNTTWQNAGALGYEVANPATVVDAHIGELREQVYPNAGGNFKFKAFLHSDGSDRAELDRVDLAYSVGRLVVTAPNGGETGPYSWLVGYPHVIRWATEGTVSHNLAIEYSTNSGVSWMLIAAGVSNTGSYVWTTPGTAAQDEQNHVRIRISDLNDTTIWDVSDGDFEIKWRFNVVAPNGGERWYIGRTNTIVWEAARNLNTVVIDLAPDGTNYSRSIVFGYGGVGGTSNFFPWATTNTTAGFYANWVSETARIRVQSLAGFGADVSDNPFTLAGIVITDPTSVSAWKKGNPFNIRWTSAGAGPTVKIEFSATGPAGPYVTITNAAPNVAGANSYLWLIDVNPTPLGVLKITSNSDPLLVGYSEVFTVADITLLDPAGGVDWLMNTPYTIRWLAAGAGPEVNIYYSTNSGGSWMAINALPVANLDTPATNSFVWSVQPFPTRFARIRVESVLDPTNLYGVSPDFNIAGVKMLSPKAGDKWIKGSLTNSLIWTHQSAGSTARLKFSYDGGNTYTDVAPFSVNLSDFAFPYTPVIPTVRGVGRIDADDPSPFTNVWATSDTNVYMTVAGILMQAPTNGAVYTIGTVNDVKWISAGSEDPLGQGRIYYASDGANFTNLIATVGNNQAFPGGNTYNWPVSPLTEPSANARLRVESGGFTHETPTFTVRGIRINQPVAGAALTIGGNAPIAWKQAGLSPDAAVNLQLSTDGGLTWDPTPLNAVPWPANAEVFGWSPVTPSADPTTNAMIRMTVVSSSIANDIGYEARSRVFTLKGMKIKAPTAADTWVLKSTNVIQWLSAGAGSPVDIYYAANGVSFDTTRPIAANRANVNGLNSNVWALETFRSPSTNARIKVQSALESAISEPFRVHGIRVTAPVNTDIWAMDETNRIAWQAIGTVGNFTLELIKDGGAPELIVAGVTTNYFDWVVPSNAISSNAVIRVTDGGGYVGDSLAFQVVGEPTIALVDPAPGDYWRVSDTMQIAWSKGGKMVNNFSVKYSTSPFIVTNDINGTVTYDPTNNTFNMPWTVPDRIGPTRISVQHNEEAAIFDESQVFYVVGHFTVLYPNGGENNLYALKPATVNWYTRGSVNAVNLYYSADPLHQVWSLIASNVPNNGLGLNDVLTTYDWTVPHLWTDDIGTVRFRVEQADRPGAGDDSDADFWIRYYAITWHVYNQATSNELDNLSVSDSSGWSAAGLTSPVTRKYPYGTFDTIWSRALFFDKVIFNWLSEPARDIFVPLTSSSADPDYTVLSSFYYDAVTNRFYIQSWISRAGNILQNPSTCTISIYDKDGNLVDELTSSTADAQGVFWQEWVIPAGLDRKQIYFAKVSIIFSGAAYSSGVTYTLRLPADLEQAEIILAAIDNARTSIVAEVATVDSNVNTLAAAEAAFRLTAGAQLETLTNLATRIDAGVTNLSLDLADFRTQALARLDTLTNTIGVIGPGGTTVVERLEDLRTEFEARTARILTRPTTVRIGSTLTIYYRTKPSVTPAPVLEVRNGLGALVFTVAMSETALGTGIFEAPVTVAAGTYVPGEYWVICSDATGNDRIGLQVTAIALDDLAELINVSNRLDGIEAALAEIALTTTNIATDVGSLLPLTNLLEAVDRIETNLASLTNLPAALDQLGDDLSNRLNGVEGDLDGLALLSSNIQTRVNTLTNLPAMVTSLLPLTNLPAQVTALRTTVNTLTNLPVEVAAVRTAVNTLTNLPSAVSTLQTTVNGLTNLPDAVSTLQTTVNGLTNLPEQVAALGSLTNLTPILTNLTETLADVDWGALSNVTALATNIETIQRQTAEINWTNVTDILAQVTNLASLTTVIGEQTAVIDWEAVEAMALSLALFQQSTSNTWGALDSDLAQVMSGLETIQTELGRQSGLSTSVNMAMKKAQSASSAANKAGTAAQAAKRELGQGRIDQALALLRELRQSLRETARGGAEGESSGVTAGELNRRINEVIARINELAEGQGSGPVMGEGEAAGISESDREAIAQLNGRLEEARAMMALLQSLMEQTVNKPVVVDWLESGGE